uniref:3-ketoacyl-CoA synthase n=1 Tax=Tetradesmus obliquus TaxID=3088 RepID=A0A383VE34_TETOB|eukprot:jgi/Sobl393_1/15889/SZX63200.1
MAPPKPFSKRAYSLIVNNILSIVMLPLLGVAAVKLQAIYTSGELLQYVDLVVSTSRPMNVALVSAVAVVAVAAVLKCMFSRPSSPVYLVDFAVHKGLDEWKFSKDLFIPMSAQTGRFTDEELDFQKKILYRSGLGDETYVPPWLYSKPQYFDYEHARKEFEVTCFSAIKDLLNKTGVQPRQISMVITNSSLFNPTPSLSATIMHHFKMPHTTLNYNLGGMGCSAGLVAIDLARQTLQLFPDSYALVVSHENLTNNWYPGCDRSMLVPNCIFRSNGAAILLSNKSKDSRRAKYELKHLVRTTVSSDEAFGCVYQMEDDKGIRGVRLGKELMSVAGAALKINMTRLGPKVLPLSEQLLFAFNLVARQLMGPKQVKAYVPDFGQAFDHICIHTGGRAVLDTMEKQLALSTELMEPSRAGLYRFGNVSSTSIWYVLAFIESFRGVRAGERVWQLGFGSGFKVNSAVWVANKKNKVVHSAWEGFNISKMRAEFAEAEAEKQAYLAAKAAASGGATPAPAAADAGAGARATVTTRSAARARSKA